MKKAMPFILCITPLAVLAMVCFSFSKEGKANKQPPIANGFAVVELFTSEGCSSCPAADEALEKIAKENNANVFLLGFHVDYWDRLGWKDVFGNAAYSNRQRQYAEVFEKDGVYTPQAIVNGSAQFVGSDEDKLSSEIKKQLSSAGNAMPVINSVKLNASNVDVNVTVKESSSTIINTALVQLHATTKVARGENGGRQLSHVNIVRDFKSFEASNTASIISLAMPTGVSAGNLRVIVYTQQSHTLKITGAAFAAIQ